MTLELHNAILKKLHDLALHDFHTVVQVGLDCELLFFLLSTTPTTHLNDLLVITAGEARAEAPNGDAAEERSGQDCDHVSQEPLSEGFGLARFLSFSHMCNEQAQEC